MMVNANQAEERSRLLAYLPGIYQDANGFLSGFLRIFEAIWTPIEAQIDEFPTLFHPYLTPSDFLPWLSTWVDLSLDENWPIERRRILVYHAADLYARRGTRRALRDYLRIYSNVAPDIIEDGIDNSSQETFRFTVRFEVEDPDTLERLEQLRDRIERIIQTEKPAHTTYRLVIQRRAQT